MNSRKTTITIVLLVIFVITLFVSSIALRFFNQGEDGTARFAEDAKKYQNLGGNFTLDHLSGSVQLDQLTQKGTVVMYFGFTRCPDICPTSLANLAAGLAILNPEQRQQIVPIMMSTDPEYDTLELLDQYVRFFVPDMLGLGGTLEATQHIAQQYGAYFNKVPLPNSALGYTVDHTTRLYVITSDGIGTLFEHNLPPEEIASILRAFTS